VLALCVVWPRNMAPVLTIVFIADCAMLLGATALIGVGIALNVALWIIAAMSWHVSQPAKVPARVHRFSIVRRAHRLVRKAL
jgi:hypothetical protein